MSDLSDTPSKVSRRRPIEPSVVYADEALLVVSKPPGFVSVSGYEDDPGLPELLVAHGLVPPDEPFRVVHRLDREASGVLVFPRTLAAQQSLTEQFEQRQIEKTYLAIVQGRVVADGQIDAPIWANSSGTRASVDLQRGKPASTAYQIAERLAGHTLLRCTTRTGRLHQVRVHLAGIGHPLAVDPLYGGGRAVLLSALKPDYRPNRRRGELPLIDRLTLHALLITLGHPVTGQRVTFEAPPPRDFRAAVLQLRRRR